MADISAGAIVAFLRAKDEMSATLKTASANVDALASNAKKGAQDISKLSQTMQAAAEATRVLSDSEQKAVLRMMALHEEANKLNQDFNKTNDKAQLLASNIDKLSSTATTAGAALGAPTAGLVLLNSAGDVTAIVMGKMATGAVGFNAATIGVVGAALAAGAALGSFLRYLGEGEGMLGLNTKALDANMAKLLGYKDVLAGVTQIEQARLNLEARGKEAFAAGNRGEVGPGLGENYGARLEADNKFNEERKEKARKAAEAIKQIETSYGNAMIAADKKLADARAAALPPVEQAVAAINAEMDAVLASAEAKNYDAAQIANISGKYAALAVTVEQTAKREQEGNQQFKDFMQGLEQATTAATVGMTPLEEALTAVAAKVEDAKTKLDAMKNAGPGLNADQYAEGVVKIDAMKIGLEKAAVAEIQLAQATASANIVGDAQMALMEAQQKLTNDIGLGLEIERMKIDAVTAANVQRAMAAFAAGKITVEALLESVGAYAAAGEAAKKYAEQQAKISEAQKWSQATDDILGLARSLQRLPDEFKAATDSNNRFLNALGGAEVGSKIGGQLGKNIGMAVGGPLGAAIGESIGKVGGAIIGGIAGLFRTPSWVKVGRDAGAVLGIEIGKEMAKQIEKTAKDLGVSNKVAALLNLDKVISDSGRAASTFGKPMMDLLKGIADGTVPAKEGMDELNKSFAMLTEEARAGSMEASKLVVQILQAGRASKTMSSEMKSFVADSLKSAQEGVKAMIAANTIAVISSIEKLKKDGQKVFQTVLDSDATLANATSQGYIFAAAFWATAAEQGIVAAGQAFKDSWDAYKQQLAEAQIDPEALSAITAPIDAVMSLFENETTRNLVEGLDGATKAVKGLGDAGYMTQGAFNALGQQAVSTYARLAGEGGEGVDPKVALQAIAPALAEVQRQSQLYGLTIDENTQALIDQANAAGIAFPTDPLQEMVRLLQEVVDTIREINGLPVEVKTTNPNIVVPGPPNANNSFAGGFYSPELPTDMTMRVHRGERVEVTPAEDTPGRNARGGGAGNVAMTSAPIINLMGPSPDALLDKLMEKLQRNDRGNREKLRLMMTGVR